MSLNKKTMVREIGRRTRLNNRDVERVIETLVEVWTEELVSGGRIDIEHWRCRSLSATGIIPFCGRRFGRSNCVRVKRCGRS